MTILISIIVLAIAIGLIIAAWPLFLTAVLAYGAYRVIRYYLKERYFNSDEFLEHKRKIDATINDYNEISDYVKSIPNNSQFLPKEDVNSNSDLATFENTSNHNYKRNKNQKHLNSRNVVQVSLAVVRKASEEPIKYVCKYFNIKPTEENLEQLEEIDTNISRMENTVANLESRQQEIETGFNPPKFIKKYYNKELLDKIGMDIPNINIEYSKYVFEYVSAGGNSSQKSTITFNGRTVEAIAAYISARIKYNKSAKAQRSLMTNSLREQIKERDDYTCQMCSASIAEQSLLLLEVDHKIPVAKGGLTTPDNLQTLCWKCNRTKSDKILEPTA